MSMKKSKRKSESNVKNSSGNTAFRNLWDTRKSVLRGKFIRIRYSSRNKKHP